MLIHITDMNNRNRRGQLSFVVSCHSTHRLQHLSPCKALAEHVHLHRHNYDTAEHISVLTQCLFATTAKELLEMLGLISALWGLTFVTSTSTLEVEYVHWGHICACSARHGNFLHLHTCLDQLSGLWLRFLGSLACLFFFLKESWHLSSLVLCIIINLAGEGTSIICHFV